MMSDKKTGDGGAQGATGSPFMQAAPDLVALGFHVVPLAEKKKYPGEYTRGEWRPQSEWQRFRDRQPTPFEWEVWRTWPNANVGIVCGSKVGDDQVVAVDIDASDLDEIEEILACLPRSPMAKKGQKGLTLFYRGDARLRTRKYDRNGRESLCEILTGQDTRQTVVPPSIHPITDTAYFWTRGPVPAEDLPALTPDDIEVLEETLQGLGWNEFDTHQPRRAEFIATGKAEWLDTPFAELNRDALQNLDAWVHDLDLYDLKKARRGYEAVNTWRESSTGQPLSKRKRNLSIQPSGIADWGSNERFSPIDLVMTAKGFGFDDAFVWLHTAIYGEAPPITLAPTHTFQAPPGGAESSGEIVIDAAAMFANAQAGKPAEPELDVAEDDSDLIGEAPVYPPFAADAGLRKWRDVPPVWIVEQIVEWICGGAPKPLPAIAIAAALSTISTAIGRQYETPREGATGLYLLGLAESGTGKNRPLMAPADILMSGGMGHLIGPSTWTAGSVLENHLKTAPVAVCVVDEFADSLAKMTAYNASGAERSKLKVLKELYSIGFSTYKTQAMAAATAETLHAPQLGIFAAATPGLFYSTLTGDAIEGGFFNRWVVVYDEPDENEAAIAKAQADMEARMMGDPNAASSVSKPPKYIVDAIARLHKRRDTINFAASAQAINGNFAASPERVLCDREAITVYRHYLDWTSDGVRAAAPDAVNFYARSAENALRIATILAVAELTDRELETSRITVRGDHMLWACRFVDWSTRRTVTEAAGRMNANRNAALMERIQSYMAGKAGKWIERRQLVNRFHKEVRSSRELDEMLQTLVDAGRIEITQQNSRQDGRGGRPKMLFKIAKGLA